jgi:hypothetical protein
MRRGLLLVGFGLGGLALALGLTLAAFAFTGDDLGTPANPIVQPSPGETREPRASGTDKPERSETPSATPSASDDHGGTSGSGSDDHSGSGSSGSGSDSSGSGSSGSGSGSSGSGSDHSGSDD